MKSDTSGTPLSVGKPPTAGPNTGVDAAADIAAGRTSLGIEFGSTRIKACLVGGDPSHVLGVGAHEWRSTLSRGFWTYTLEEVWTGLQGAYADLVDALEQRYGVRPSTFGAIGVSAMMHGYLAFDGGGRLLTPFRTWRNTNTGRAAARLTEAFGVNIPLRWSVAHLYQALLDGEEHVANIASLTTLAGYVHRALTGVAVLGIGDASGMFPIDPVARVYDAVHLAQFDALVATTGSRLQLASVLPPVAAAGANAGSLTASGARLIDPTGRLAPGIPFCPPEGDAGTGMVATNAIAAGRGNLSAGTSIFAMVVLERPLRGVHPEVDAVTTPDGSPVAMVHCNNGAGELGEWAGVFARFAAAAGVPMDSDRVYEVLLNEASAGAVDASGITAYTFVSGEPIIGVPVGRPLVVRAPDAVFTLGNLMRAELYAVFAPLRMGMDVLAAEGVRIDRLVAHGGLFRTTGVAQGALAAALDAPVTVAPTASEGGAWGMAVLAAYRRSGAAQSLPDFLEREVFAGIETRTVMPATAETRGYADYFRRFVAGLPLQHTAAESFPR